MASKKKEKRLRITLRKGLIGEKPRTRATVRGLGLRRIDSAVIHADTPDIQGMVRKVSHLVEVEELSG